MKIILFTFILLASCQLSQKINNTKELYPKNTHDIISAEDIFKYKMIFSSNLSKEGFLSVLINKDLSIIKKYNDNSINIKNECTGSNNCQYILYIMLQKQLKQESKFLYHLDNLKNRQKICAWLEEYNEKLSVNNASILSKALLKIKECL